MISYLKGNLIDNTEQFVTIDVGGVGYAVYTTDHWKTKHTLLSECTLFIYTHVKEDALELYGFDSNPERRLFQLLLSVSGVGPRTALHILNHGVTHIEKAISQADVSFFTSIPRIGKKNAQKIIIELKNKIGSVNEINLNDEPTGMEQDIILALTSMGFSKQEVQQVLQKYFDSAYTIEQNIKTALKHLSQ